jgi:hypothetical protein
MERWALALSLFEGIVLYIGIRKNVHTSCPISSPPPAYFINLLLLYEGPGQKYGDYRAYTL